MEDYLGKLGKMSAVHAIPLRRNYKIKVFKRDKNILISLNVYIFLNIYVVSNTLIYHLKVFMLYTNIKYEIIYVTQDEFLLC